MEQELENDAKTILIVDDEQPIVDILVYNLQKEGYKTIEASDGITAVELATEKRPDLILLDIMLPRLDGLSVCKRIKNSFNVPIIMLTAKDGEIDKILGLELGADDYITKPFEIREVLARVQVQLRHKEEKEAGREHNLSFKNMVLNRDTFQVRIDGRILPKITKQEFAILELLLRNPKQVFSKEDIFEYAWDEPYMGETKTLDVHISNIRKKIKQVTSDEYIETVWGIGYRLHA